MVAVETVSAAQQAVPEERLDSSNTDWINEWNSYIADCARRLKGKSMQKFIKETQGFFNIHKGHQGNGGHYQGLPKHVQRKIAAKRDGQSQLDPLPKLPNVETKQDCYVEEQNYPPQRKSWSKRKVWWYNKNSWRGTCYIRTGKTEKVYYFNPKFSCGKPTGQVNPIDVKLENLYFDFVFRPKISTGGPSDDLMLNLHLDSLHRPVSTFTAVLRALKPRAILDSPWQTYRNLYLDFVYKTRYYPRIAPSEPSSEVSQTDLIEFSTLDNLYMDYVYRPLKRYLVAGDETYKVPSKVKAHDEPKAVKLSIDENLYMDFIRRPLPENDSSLAAQPQQPKVLAENDALHSPNLSWNVLCNLHLDLGPAARRLTVTNRQF